MAEVVQRYVRPARHGERQRRPCRADRLAELGAAACRRPPSVPVEVTDFYYRVPAAGGINGSIKDLAIWMLAQMGLEPDVLPPAVLNAVQTPRIRTPRRESPRAASSASARQHRATGSAGGSSIMRATGSIGHHGGVQGYRSMIMFDPALQSGVVVLWNSRAIEPRAGIEYEVMDMVYRLPFRDWLELDRHGGGAAPEEPPTDSPSAS